MSTDTEILKSRLDLPNILQPQSIGIELGVAGGYYSDILLKSSKFSKLYSIDRWSDHHGIDEYLSAARKLATHGPRSIVIKASFDDIIDLFPEDYFDLIYIDAYAHTGQEDGLILENWFPKLKSGGIFSGHDYEEKQWPKTFSAVNKFIKNKKLSLNIIPGQYNPLNNEDRFKSWFTLKH